MENKYRILKRFAVGGFAVVFKGIRKEDGKVVAIKRIRMNKGVPMYKISKGRKIPLEIALLLRLRGIGGVVQLLDFYKEPRYFWMILEKPYASIDLREYSYNHGPFNNQQAQCIIRQVVNIMIQLHSQNVFHSDVKEENILLNTRTFKIKLIDFGCSTILKENFCTKYQGTLLYAPPEWILRKKYDPEKATVWSIGVLAYAMIRGKRPFLYKTHIPVCNLPFGPRFGWRSTSFISQCFIKNPKKRPTLKKLVRHTWMTYKP